MVRGIDWLESLLEQQKQGDLTVGAVTPGESPVTPRHVRAVTPKPVTGKRRYKARARRCECCHETFTPKRNVTAKYCSDRCRKKNSRAKMAKQNRGEMPPVERAVEVCTCLWCGGTWLAEPSRDPKYCSPSHRTAAYRQRRYSAIEAVATIKAYAPEKAAQLIQVSGMRKTTSWLRRHGYAYDEQIRRWRIAVQTGDIFTEKA